MDRAFFEFWVKEYLMPELPGNSVIIMDNASFHKKASLEEIFRSEGHKLMFLPPYSPQLNPIERYWASLKRKLRKILPQHKSLDSAITCVFQGA